MKERSKNKDGITKTKDFSQRTTEELGSSKDINGNGKRSYEEAIWQEETKLLGVEIREQYVVWSQKNLIEATFKEVGPKKIRIFWNHKEYWIESISVKVIRRMDDIQYIQ